MPAPAIENLKLERLTVPVSEDEVNTQLKQLAAVGLKPVLLMLGETVFLAALVALQLRLAGSP